MEKSTLKQEKSQAFKEVDLDTDTSLDSAEQGIATIKLRNENSLSIEESSDSSTRSAKRLLKVKKEQIRSSVRKFVFSNVEILFLADSLMPILALLYDTIYPMATNYSHVIENICDNKNVDQNFWPSLSGTIGYSNRTRLIWLVFIISHAPLRFLGAFYLRTSYLKFHEKSFEYESLSAKGRKQLKQYFNLRQIIKLAHFINILEIISLCSLAIYMYFYFDKHRYGVILFLYYSFAFILLNLYVEYHLKSRGILNFFYTKVIIGCLFTISFITIIVSYLHICEPYANSIFGISEMTLVVTNVMYHSLSYFTIKALANLTLEEMKNRDRYVEESSYL